MHVMAVKTDKKLCGIPLYVPELTDADTATGIPPLKGSSGSAGSSSKT